LPLEMALGRGQTTEVGAYANQRLNLAKLGRPMEEMPWFRTGPVMLSCQLCGLPLVSPKFSTAAYQ
ncbi:MAG: hypothetical protein WCA20_18565, partial [Candidatus Sulfotelmatobacter sp.]